MSEDRKRIQAEEIGLKTDEEALNFVRLLRKAGTSVFFLTNGDNERWIVGKFDNTIPLLPLALKQKIESLEKEVENMKVLIQELKVIKAIEPLPQQKIELPSKTLTENNTTEIVAETPKLGFKSRQEVIETKVIPEKVPTQTVTFKCPSCEYVFSENIPKVKGKGGPTVVEVRCPKCGMTIYKKSWWTRRKKIGIAGLVCLVLFFIWLFI